MTDDLRNAIAYGALLGRIEEIDPKAAQWMRDNPQCVTPRGNLYRAFAWYDTPQGTAYWRSIAEKLGEL